MDDVSEDENPEAFVTSSKNPNPKEHRSRAERQHALEKLMEDDDDDGSPLLMRPRSVTADRE